MKKDQVAAEEIVRTLVDWVMDVVTGSSVVFDANSTSTADIIFRSMEPEREAAKELLDIVKGIRNATIRDYFTKDQQRMDAAILTYEETQR